MNKTKRILICAAGLTLGAFGSSMAFGQDVGGNLEANVDLRVDAGLDTGVPNAASRYTASQRLIARASLNADNLSEEMQADLSALEAAQAEIVAAWEAAKAELGDTPTEEQIEEARAAFETQMEAQIETAVELRKSIITELRDDLRAQVGSRNWGTEAKAKFAAYGQAKAELNSSWEEAKAELGEDATRAEVAAAREAFLEANADLIVQQKGLAAELRALVRSEMRANRPQIDREATPAAIAELRADIQLARGNVSARREEIREEMEGLSGEARAQLRQELALELKTSFDEIKERRRQLIEDLKGGQNGDRRAED